MSAFGSHGHDAVSANLFAKESRSGGEAKSELRELGERVDKLELVAEALWRLLEEHTTLSEEDLIEKITAVDLMDGRYDGKKTPEKNFRDCPKCHRRVNRHHRRCFYCGETFLPDPFG